MGSGITSQLATGNVTELFPTIRRLLRINLQVRQINVKGYLKRFLDRRRGDLH